MLYKAVIFFAIGEGLAAFCSDWAQCWPVLAVLSGIVLLIGYGRNLLGWRHLFALLLGVTLFFHQEASVRDRYRDKPWMRKTESRIVSVQPAHIQSIKSELSRRMGLGLEHEPEIAALNRAMVLGERRRISPKLKDRFVESGTIHVFAISGLHVMVVAKVFMVLLAFVGLSVRCQGLLVIPMLWGYVYLIGLPPSAVRAALMASLYLLAPFCWRKSDALRAWELSFLIVHIINPSSIVNTGSQLSFSVVLALILCGRAVKHWPEEWPKQMIMIFAAWIGGMPIAATVFGRITPGGLLANIFILGAAGYSIVAGIIGILISFISETLAAHINNFAALMTRLMVGISSAVAKLPGSNFEIGKWSVAQCLELYIVIALVAYLAIIRRNRRESTF